MNTNETIELEDLALTDGQQAEVKGGPVLQDCLVSSYQSGGHDGGANPGAANIIKINTSTPSW